jgi:aldehyde dehydrogenase (NAD+)
MANKHKELTKVLQSIGVPASAVKGKDLTVHSPIDGALLATLACDTQSSTNEKIINARKAFDIWRQMPAPKRGELIRLFGEELRAAKDDLGKLVSLECGKVLEEGKGEVQEMIDICDFAVGLSRTAGGLTIPSERHSHVMQENWHPLGVVGVISAFNFPVAVWAWNFTLAIVCGNSVLWKPSELTPLCAIACQTIFKKAVKRFSHEVPEGLSDLIIGNARVGELVVNDRRVALVSATGSTRMGQIVGTKVAERFGRCLLELGGNNAIIVTPSADLDVALGSIVFGAVGTAGQRCTTTRRLIVHRSLYRKMAKKLEKAYQELEPLIGSPLRKNTLIGPLIHQKSFEHMQHVLKVAASQGGKVVGGNRVLEKKFPDGYYVEPTLVKMKSQTAIVKQETFAPILYLIPYDTLEEALAIQNDVPQGLSSSIFTTDLREAEYFRQNSDCGLANVNIGTSGAEIGGAFGGEKETGGGRESGSDSWKHYMRRQTSTTYYGNDAPELAQGIRFTF